MSSVAHRHSTSISIERIHLQPQNKTIDTNKWSAQNKTNDTNKWSAQNKTDGTNKWCLQNPATDPWGVPIVPVPSHLFIHSLFIFDIIYF